jgi:hypothetical protein
MDTTTVEEWRPVTVAPFCEFYEVSSLGRVRGCNRTRYDGHIFSLRPTPNGYVRVTLQVGGGRRHIMVHRLVAEAFIPNPDGLPEVNHIDLVKTNNAVTNLEWKSGLGNYLHAVSAGVMHQFPRKLSDNDVVAIRALRSRGLTTVEIGKRYGITRGSVSRIATGTRRRG